MKRCEACRFYEPTQGVCFCELGAWFLEDRDSKEPVCHFFKPLIIFEDEQN